MHPTSCGSCGAGCAGDDKLFWVDLAAYDYSFAGCSSCPLNTGLAAGILVGVRAADCVCNAGWQGSDPPVRSNQVEAVSGVLVAGGWIVNGDFVE